MTEAGHIKIKIQTYGLAAMKCYHKSSIRIETHRPHTEPVWYELYVYQNDDALSDDSHVNVFMSREQLEALRNEIDKALEGKE